MTTSEGRNTHDDFFTPTEAWKQAYSGACVGILALGGAANPAKSAALEPRKQQLEAALRSRWAGVDRSALRSDPVLKAYYEHYKRFDKTYHVQLQLESILFKDKPIPSSAALVEAMFMAEVDSLLLTAGHDLDAIQGSLVLDVAGGTESYMLMRGTAHAPQAGDMMISDSVGIISSIVYGPDQRTQITPETTRAVFTTYCPAGIGAPAVEAHLLAINRYATLISPKTRIELLRVYAAE